MATVLHTQRDVPPYEAEQARHLEPRRSGDLAFATGPDEGLAVVAPLPLGATLDGLGEGGSQRDFLEFVGAGRYLVVYDQRGSGRSAGSLPGSTPEALGRDLWAVADAAGIERAVLYGVFDAGLTAIEAARQCPERVLGLVLNFVPPSIGAPPGLREEQISSWCAQPSGALDVLRLLLDIGVHEGEARALAAAWDASGTPDSARARIELLRGVDVSSLRTAVAPGLVLEPQRRQMFQGWGRALAEQYPRACVVETARGAEALGAIDAFLEMLTDQQGRRASHLSPAEARTISDVAAAAQDVRVVLVPVTADWSSPHTVDLACQLAGARDATILLASIVVVPRVRALNDPPPEALQRAAASLRLAEAVAVRREAAFRSTTCLARGFVDGVVRTAAEQGADLVVLPNPGEGVDSLDQEALHELFTRTPCEVLIDRSSRRRGGAAR